MPAALPPDVVEFLRLAAGLGKLTQREAAALIDGLVPATIRVERDLNAPPEPLAGRVKAVLIDDRLITLDQ